MKSGEILLNTREAIYLYNPKNYNFIKVDDVFDWEDEVYGHIYVESLVKTTVSNKGQNFLEVA